VNSADASDLKTIFFYFPFFFFKCLFPCPLEKDFVYMFRGKRNIEFLTIQKEEYKKVFFLILLLNHY